MMPGRIKHWAFLAIALGVWQLAVTLTFGHKTLSIYVSDLISGMLMIFLGCQSVNPQRVWSGWAIGGVGLWLQLSPLIFWAPLAITYLNDTLVGILLMVIAFQFHPDPFQKETTLSHCPQGWSFNPSAWANRIPTVGFGLLCWFCARYMAAYQLGYIDQIWDPIFENGTLNVITSKISHEFPVSDAGLGALCYTMESVLGWQGSQRRWHTMPWLVLIFGILVVPVSAVSILLIILQPVAVGSWCAWCLATAAFMLPMIVLTAPELVAVIQFLKQKVQAGHSFWSVLWEGGEPFKNPQIIKPADREPGHPALGMTFPLNIIGSALLGAWIMASPTLFSLKGMLATTNYIIGPLVIAVSVISFAEVLRGIRYMNIILGLALMGISWSLSEQTTSAHLNDLIVGLLILALSLRKGKITERYGDWERLIR